MESREIRTALERILPTVERPGRYLGLERNLTHKEWDSVDVRFLLAFPDEYGVGMSHLGTRILYHIANRRPDTLCERTFAPWPDMARALRQAGVPLYSLESYRAAAAFDAIGVSLQSELNYVNVPYLLDLARLPRFAADRGDDHPLVVGGGPCTANPEPVADFFDILAVGDGEVLLPVLLDALRDAKREGWPRLELLRRLAHRDGFYVPAFYGWRPHGAPRAGGSFERLDAAAPERVRRVFAERLDPADLPAVPIVPAVEVIQDRLGMEVARGCTQGCRFCQAGFWYRPVREQDPGTVAAVLERHVEATGYEEVGLLSLSTADYSQIEPLAASLAATLAPRRVSVSLPSLRADSFSVGLADSVALVRKSSFTFAPETGSDRLRRVLNKGFTNSEMAEAAAVAFGRGWSLIKVYAMVGLPSETDGDVVALADLAQQILAGAAGPDGRRPRGGAEVKVSVGPFVPKAWTPFQWEPFGPAAELRRRIALLRERFRSVRSPRGTAKLSWGEPEESALEALLSRGDRRLGRVISRAHDLGAVFDGWNEWRNPDAWQQAIAEAGLDLDGELGPRDLAAPLPWEIIDAGVRPGYLKAERRRGLEERRTLDCRAGLCTHCGIPGDGADTVLASPLPGGAAEAVGGERPRDAADRISSPPAQPDEQPPLFARYRFRFSKRGDARWLSHRNVMDLLERALRAAAVPVRYTEGHNPHIRLSMGPALALGYESADERFDVDCHAALEPGMLSRANRVLPGGLQIDACEALPPSSPSLGKAVAACRYRLLLLPDAQAPWPPAPPPGTDGVLAWEVAGEALYLTLNARQATGPAPSVKSVLAASGFETGGPGAVRVLREQLVVDRL